MRRTALVLLLLVGVAALLALAACAKPTPTPTPAPTATPLPPTPAPTLPPGVTPTATPLPPTPVPAKVIGIPTAVLPAGEPDIKLVYTPAPLLPPKPGVYKSYEEAMKDWPNVLAAAKKEGSVNTVTAAPAPKTWIEEVNAALEKKYGIRVVYGAGGRIGDNLPKFKAERATGRYNFDIWPTGPSWVRQACADGFCDPFVTPSALEPGVEWLVDPLAEGPHLGTGGQVYLWQANMPFINTNLVPPEREPRKLWDLCDPYWKGKVAAEDPRAYGPMTDYLTYVMLVPGYGWKHLECFIGSFSRVYSSATLAADDVVKGAYAVAPMVSSSRGEALAKLPKPWNWKFVHVEDGDMGWVLTSFILPNGPHPNAARVYADFLTSREADEIKAKYYGIGTARRIPGHITPDLVYPTKLFPVDYGAYQVTTDILPKLMKERVIPLLEKLGL